MFVSLLSAVFVAFHS